MFPDFCQTYLKRFSLYLWSTCADTQPPMPKSYFHWAVPTDPKDWIREFPLIPDTYFADAIAAFDSAMDEADREELELYDDNADTQSDWVLKNVLNSIIETKNFPNKDAVIKQLTKAIG